MPSLTERRIRKELRDMRSCADPPLHVSAGPVIRADGSEDIFHWKGTLIGTSGTPYEGGVFLLDIMLGQEGATRYPFAPPMVRFETPIFHCNIDTYGSVCLSILKDGWSPALTIQKVLLSVCSLMSDQNPDDPLNRFASQLYTHSRPLFTARAMSWTARYAQSGTAEAVAPIVLIPATSVVPFPPPPPRTVPVEGPAAE